MSQTGVGCPHGRLAQFISVQVNEADLLTAQLSTEPALEQHQISVALVTRTLADHNAIDAQLEEPLGNAHRAA